MPELNQSASKDAWSYTNESAPRTHQMSPHLTGISEGRICCMNASTDLEKDPEVEKNTPHARHKCLAKNGMHLDEIP